MKKCTLLECSNNINSKDKRTMFCSRRCAAIHNQRTGAIRRTSTHRLNSVCGWCQMQFTYIKTRSNGYYCSNKCNGLAKSAETKKQWLAEDAKVLKTITRDSIRRYLIEEVGNKCSIEGCSVGASWLDKDITLVVDHIDGNAMDNSISNVRLLCPNCNSQTDTFSGRNKGNGRRSRRMKLH